MTDATAATAPSHGIAWYPSAEAYLAPHEIAAIDAGADKPGHDLADDERGRHFTCERGELAALESGQVVLVGKDGRQYIVGELHDVEPEPERDLGGAPDDAHAHDAAAHLITEPEAMAQIEELVSAAATDAVTKAFEARDRELADERIARTTAEARVRDLEARLAALAASSTEAVKPQ